MLEIMYDIPSRDEISKCVITRDTILKKEKPMLVSIERKKKKEESA